MAQQHIAHSVPDIPCEQGLDMPKLEQMYDMLAERLHHFFVLRTGDIYLAQEFTSIVFERAIARRSTFKSQKGTAEIWLWGIAKNVLRDHYRHNRAHIARSVTLEMDITDANTPEQSALYRQELVRLKDALTILNARERTILSLKYASCLRNTQVAQLMHLSPKNVGVILSRAIKKLRDNMNEEEQV